MIFAEEEREASLVDISPSKPGPILGQAFLTEEPHRDRNIYLGPLPTQILPLDVPTKFSFYESPDYLCS